MKKIFYLLIALSLLVPYVSFAQLTPNYGGTGMTSWLSNLIPFGVDQFSATTTSSFNYATATSRLSTPNLNVSGTASTTTLCLIGDSCRTTWPTGGTGSGNVGTSTSEVANQIAVFASTGATPALIGGDADFLWDGAANSFTVTGTGSFSGLLELSSGAKFNGGGTAAISYNNPTLALTSPDSISLTAGSIPLNVDGTEGVYVLNNQAYRAKDTGGTARDLIKLDTSNIVNVGNSSSETTILGTNTRISGLSDGCLVSTLTVISTQTCGSGTVDSGTTGQFPYYAANGTTVTGTSTVFLSTAGNIGVGTTSPYAKLSINGATGNTTVPVFAIGTTTAGGAHRNIFRVNADGGFVIGQSGNPAGSFRFESTSGAAYFGTVGHGEDTNNGPYVGITSTNIDLQLISGARSFWIASGGSRDSGINMQVTSPFTAASARMLVIANRNNSTSGNATGISLDSTWATGSGTASDTDILINRTETSLAANGSHDFIRGMVSSVNRFRITNLGGAWFNGDVGIGTTTPWAKLSIGSHNLANTSPSFVIASSSTGVATSTQFVVTNGNVGIGTSTPLSKLVIQGASSVGLTPALVVSSSTNSTVFSVSGGGHIKTGGETPTVSTCGTGPSVSGNDTAGTVTVGSGVVTACTLTFAAPRSGTPRVVGVVTGGGLNVAGGYSAKSSTAVTFSFATTVGGGTFDYYIVE